MAACAGAQSDREFAAGARDHRPEAARYPKRSMSFLDNLESNLKALESRTERAPTILAREAAAREAAGSTGLEIAPHAEALRNGTIREQSPDGLSKHRTQQANPGAAGVGRCNPSLGSGARRNWNCVPTPTGVVAVFFDGGIRWKVCRSTWRATR